MADEIPSFDLYAELEVSALASTETIRAAYRSLQLRNHPDRVGPDAGDRAVRLNVARDWLTDPARRARYDAHLVALREAAVDTAVAADADDDHDGEDKPMGYELDEAEVDETPAADTWRPRIRIDLGRLVRIWVVGLALLGALALAPGWAPPAVRVTVAVAAVLVLVGLTIRRTRPPAREGLASRAARTGWAILSWISLAGLAVEGGATALAASDRTAGLADVIAPVVAATAVASLFAFRRRHGPVQATVDDFLEMTPREFESAVGEILRNHGYRLRLTGGPGDLVADLLGTDPEGRPTIVQCKRYAPGHPVGSRDVQLLIAMGVRHHKAERLILVTTSDFTDPAIDLAEEHRVTLISGDELEDLTR